MTIDLTGKIVLVTGASRGIGKAIAEALGKVNAKVIVHCNTSINEAILLAKQIGNDSKAYQADLSDPIAVENFFDKVMNDFEKIDVLVNNAGMAISSDPGKSTKEWLEDWNKTIQVNLTAAALLCKSSIPIFEKQDSGIIINVSSRAAHRGDTVDYLAYAASKGGMEALTKSLARGYGKKNILVYGVAPGFTRTDMAQGFIDAYGEDYALSDIALPELTEPRDIAPTIVFLASGLAKHATGTTIDINAGSYVR